MALYQRASKHYYYYYYYYGFAADHCHWHWQTLVSHGVALKHGSHYYCYN
jgi:hypothetical protein